jgi:hypothetical protein
VDSKPTIKLVIVNGCEHEEIRFGSEGTHYEEVLSGNLYSIHMYLNEIKRYPRTIEQMKNEKMCLLCWALEGQYHHPTCVGKICPECHELVLNCDCDWSEF